METRSGAAFVVLVFLTGIGCAGRAPAIRFSPINYPATLPAKALGQVELFVTTKPERPYVELGILSFITYAYNLDDAAIHHALKQRAAELGADGIIMLETRTETATNWVTKQTYQGKVYRAMAFVYRRE